MKRKDMDNKNVMDKEVRSWEQVSINKYFELRNMPEDASNVEVYALLNDMAPEDVLNMPISEMTSRLASLNFLNTPIEPVKKIPSHIKLNGKDYKVLDGCKDMKTGQFIDYQNFIQDRERYYSNLLTTIILPSKHTYADGYDPLELANVIGNEMSITLAEGIYFFFARKSRRYMKRTLLYLRSVLTSNRIWMKDPQKKKKMKEAEKELTRLNVLIDGFQL